MKKLVLSQILPAGIVLFVLSAPAMAQPTILLPGYKIQEFEECGSKYAWLPGALQPAGDADCSPGEIWGREDLFVGRYDDHDDASGSVERVTRHGDVSLFLFGRDPTILAFSPPGSTLGDDLWIGRRDDLLIISPDGSGDGTLHDLMGIPGALDIDGSGLYSPWPHYTNRAQGMIWLLIPQQEFQPFASIDGLELRFGPGGAWGEALYINGHTVAPDGSVTPFPAPFQEFDWAEGPGFWGYMYSLEQGNIYRIEPDGTRILWGTGFGGQLAYCDGSLWVTNHSCLKITPLAIIELPAADAGPDIQVDCLCPAGTDVSLSGALSTDGNSSPGTNDDIGRFEWFEDFSLPTEVFLGEGEQLTIPFAPGSHDVTLKVTDATDETDTDELVVTVVNTNRPPVADAGADIVAECISPSGAGILMLDGTGSDDPDSTGGLIDIISFEWWVAFETAEQQHLGSGSVIPVNLGIGDHSITLVVTDAGGLSDSDSMLLTIQDTTAPELEVLVSPGVIWARDGQVQEITATVGATDLCGAATFLLKSIASSEPDDSGGGATSPDILEADYGTADLSFLLRAERDGTGPGRIYTVTYEATDQAGNQAVASAIVTVPHDQRD